MRQTALHFEFQSNQTFDNFFCGDNHELVAHLQGFIASQGEQQIYLWGEPGSGKTHLLQAACQLARQQELEVFYLDLAHNALPSPQILEGLEEVELVCFDNVHVLSEFDDWQTALFGFYNRHRQNNHRLLLTADTPPKYLAYALMDLKTRMGWGLTLKIKPLRDDQLIEALRFKAHDLGFDIPANVGRFLLNHFSHDQSAMWSLLNKIDRATLIEQRRLSIPFIKRILQTDQLD